jgi:hypothetical protein
MEDIKSQVKNLSSEEARIQDAIQKTSELRFLLGEVESKLVKKGKREAGGIGVAKGGICC